MTDTNPTGNGPEIPEPPSPRESARLVLTLAVAGLFSGLAIVGAYVGTLPRITENQARALREAVLEVVPGSARMQGMARVDGELTPVSAGAAGETATGATAEVYAAYDDAGAFLAYAIPADGAGFQDTIALIFGFDPQRKVVVGMRVLESRETPGLGDKIIKDAAFLANFQALAVQPAIKLVKNGEKTAAHEVDGITGATISAKAVVKILNGATTEWVPRFGEPGTEPPLPPGDMAAADTLPRPIDMAAVDKGPPDGVAAADTRSRGEG